MSVVELSATRRILGDRRSADPITPKSGVPLLAFGKYLPLDPTRRTCWQGSMCDRRSVITTAASLCRCVAQQTIWCCFRTQKCDWDAHCGCSVLASHDHVQIEGFSGCPFALELSSIWGFDLEDKKPLLCGGYWNNDKGGGQDVVVGPMELSSWMYNLAMGGGGGEVVSVQDLKPNDHLMFSRQSLSCRKLKQVIYKQLVELLKNG